MIDNEIDELSITEDPKFFQELTEEVWKENFEKVGYIYIGVGDEPEGCTSRVYKDKHREIVGLGDHYKLGKGSLCKCLITKVNKIRSVRKDSHQELSITEPKKIRGR